MDSIDPLVALRAPDAVPDAAGVRRAARRFGAGSLVVLGGAGAFTWLARGHFTYGALLLGVGAAISLLSLVRPAAALRLRVLWMRVARGIGALNTVLLLGLLYLLAVVPIGLLRRLVGQDTLRRIDRRASSFWQPRVDERSRERFEQPF